VPDLAQTDAFIAALRPQPRHPDRPPVPDEDYLAFVGRVIAGLEVRAVSNPALLLAIAGRPAGEDTPEIRGLAGRLADIVNVAISINADRYEQDPHAGASAAECGRVLGVSKQAASKRRERGEAVLARRLAAAGGTSLGDYRKAVRAAEADTARTERETAAASAAVDLAAYRARHAA
jgi:hypothetical protein